MTANDLKTLASRDLEGLPPMPSVVSDVLAEGARRRRRRRTVGAGLATASVIGVIAVGASALPGMVAESESSSSRATSTVVSSGPITDSEDEFTRWAARKFSEALPERFAPARPTDEFAVFVTHVGGVQVDFNLNVTLTDWANSDVEPGEVDLTPDCADGGPGETCAELPEQNAIASHETTSDSYPYAGMEMYVGDRTDAADTVHLNFFGKRHSGTPVPLTDQEILALVESPQFEQIWREVTAHPHWVNSGTIALAQPVR
jgi:hypothetical protein